MLLGLCLGPSVVGFLALLLLAPQLVEAELLGGGVLFHWRLAAGAYPGISLVAPALTQQRTMSRMESTPTSSPPSTTTRWRNLPLTIASAARSSDQPGSAKVRWAERWSATFSPSGL